MSDQVTLEMMLSCRENRVAVQQSLISSYRLPVISFCMNTAGPVKTSPLIRRAFRSGIRRLEGSLLAQGIKILSKQVLFNVTGPEAFIVADSDSLTLKRITCDIEDRDTLGRLFDLDVIDTDGRKIGRNETGRPERLCLLCSNSAKICSSRRLHTVEDLFRRTEEIIMQTVPSEEADLVASTAVKSLLYEVCVTPKPGLVDRANSGAHKDMDIFTFMGSAAVLNPYFRKAYLCGLEAKDPCACFEELRKEGLEAEKTMFLETGGVNTHKGAVFTMGIVCAAAGMCASEDNISQEGILKACADVSRGIVKRDLECLDGKDCRTKGQILFVKHGITGIRGEMEGGLPSVETGLKVLDGLLSAGIPLEKAALNALLAIMTRLEDTSLIARGGLEKAREIRDYADYLLSGEVVEKEKLEEMDRKFIEQNLSPGGAADLLAVCFFLHFMKEFNNG